jgi:hypothetical protein
MGKPDDLLFRGPGGVPTGGGVIARHPAGALPARTLGWLRP